MWQLESRAIYRGRVHWSCLIIIVEATISLFKNRLLYVCVSETLYPRDARIQTEKCVAMQLLRKSGNFIDYTFLRPNSSIVGLH